MELLHICKKTDWLQAQGQYLAASLASEGFIHCSRPEQIESVANRYYAGQSGLVLLHIDSDRLDAIVKWEAADGEEFPHIYGPISLEAITAVEDLFPGEAGQFTYPGDPD